MDQKLTLLILFLTIINPCLSTQQNPIQNYQFLTQFKIGTPPREVKTVISTQTGLTWIQCEPCDSCQPQTDPIFNPLNSTSFKSVQCESAMCRAADGAGCDRENKCAFNAVGSDGSSTEGILATENVIYNDQKFSNLMFGCVHGSSKGFGVLGLDMSKESFVNQYENLTRGRFSYCLPSLKNGDAITTVKFGDNANVLGDYTPIKVGKEGNVYNVNLLDISVGNERLNVKAGSFEMDQNGNGGTIIDAGTMISFLTQPVYGALVSKLNKTVQLAPSQPQQSQLSFCFKGTQKDLIAPKIPDLTFHFEGLNVTVPAFNVFVPVNEETVCLAILPSADVAVFGGVLQQGLNLGFDVKEMRVYMKSTDCGKV